MPSKNNSSSLLSMGKRALSTAPASVPLEKFEQEFLGVQPDNTAVDQPVHEDVRKGANRNEYEVPSGGGDGDADLRSPTRPYLPTAGQDTPISAALPNLSSEVNNPHRAPVEGIELVPERVTDRSAQQISVQRVGTRLVPLQAKKIVPTFSATYRLPLPLHRRLKRISQANGIDMTDIVVEALENHLPNFYDPGEPPIQKPE
jgi:hypothetical protein